MDSEMSTCCCFLLRQLFLVQKTAHTRGAVRELLDLVIVPGLRKEGHPFFAPFCGALFSLKIATLDENGLQNGPKMVSFGSYFLEKCENRKVCLDCAGAYGLHMSPSLGALRATQKSNKKRDIFQNRLF